MAEGVVTTGVDELLDLLRHVDRIAIIEAAEKLHVPLDTLQSWVDFLVEEKIVGLEYKFTKPFIYLNREEIISSKDALKKALPKLKEVKREYEERARAKQIPAEQIPKLWEAHFRQELAYLEQFFAEQAQRRGVQDTHERRRLWEEYAAQALARLDSQVS